MQISFISANYVGWALRLVEDGWDGTICIEHEPYDRDPADEVKRTLERVRQWL